MRFVAECALRAGSRGALAYLLFGIVSPSVLTLAFAEVCSAYNQAGGRGAGNGLGPKNGGFGNADRKRLCRLFDIIPIRWISFCSAAFEYQRVRQDCMTLLQLRKQNELSQTSISNLAKSLEAHLDHHKVCFLHFSRTTSLNFRFVFQRANVIVL